MDNIRDMFGIPVYENKYIPKDTAVMFGPGGIQSFGSIKKWITKHWRIPFTRWRIRVTIIRVDQ